MAKIIGKVDDQNIIVEISKNELYLICKLLGKSIEYSDLTPGKILQLDTMASNRINEINHFMKNSSRFHNLRREMKIVENLLDDIDKIKI